jgi:hypothetical protein
MIKEWGFVEGGDFGSPFSVEVLWDSPTLDPNGENFWAVVDWDTGNSVNGCIDLDCEEGEGCTPGFWRQEHHHGQWVGYSPNDLFSVVFGVGPAMELGDAVQAEGGGENALMRHAVAALLNATSDVDYDYTEAEVIAMVKAAFGSGLFESTKDQFEIQNELGCPLD